jgi:transposase
VTDVKLVVQVKLLPTPEEATALAATLHTCNTGANQVSALAFERFGLAVRQYDLHHLAYYRLRAQGLAAQAAMHVIKRVADAYATLRGSIRNGRLGGPESRRRRKATSKPLTFRPDAAQTYDDRNLSWQIEDRTVSIWTTAGRLRGVAFTGSAAQLKTLAAHRQGESDLVFRDGKWFVVATCEVPEAAQYEPVDWIGVDRGITNLATTSDLDNFQGGFCCRRCGLAGPADVVAAVNIRDRARRAWVLVNVPLPAAA